jgi:hypothetical protein
MEHIHLYIALNYGLIDIPIEFSCKSTQYTHHMNITYNGNINYVFTDLFRDMNHNEEKKHIKKASGCLLDKMSYINDFLDIIWVIAHFSFLEILCQFKIYKAKTKAHNLRTLIFYQRYRLGI